MTERTKINAALRTISNIITEGNKNRILNKLNDMIGFEIANLYQTKLSDSKCLEDFYQNYPPEHINK